MTYEFSVIVNQNDYNSCHKNFPRKNRYDAFTAHQSIEHSSEDQGALQSANEYERHDHACPRKESALYPWEPQFFAEFLYLRFRFDLCPT